MISYDEILTIIMKTLAATMLCALMIVSVALLFFLAWAAIKDMRNL